VLAAYGARVHQFGKHRDKLRIAEKMGVAVELAKKRMPVARYDWVVEATGSSDGLRTAIQMARPRGTVIMKSTVHGLARLDTAPVIVNEITLLGSRCGRFEPAMALLRAGKVNVADMIHDRFGLEDARRAFRRAAEKGVLKVLLSPASGG